MPGPAVAIYDSLGRFARILSYSTRPDTTARSIVAYTLDTNAGEIQVFDGSVIAFFTKDGFLEMHPAAVAPGFMVAQTTGLNWTYLVPAPIATAHPLGYMTILHTWQRPTDFTILDTITSSPQCLNCIDLLIESGLKGLGKGDLLFAVADRYRIIRYSRWGNQKEQTTEISRPWLPARAPSHYVAGRIIPEAPRLTSIKIDRYCVAALQPITPCEGKLWVAGLVMADSTQSDPNRRYATMIDVFDGLAPEMKLRHSAELKLRGRVELIGKALAYQRDRDMDGNWRITIMRFVVVD
jgi:hypothetical protein